MGSRLSLPRAAVEHLGSITILFRPEIVLMEMASGDAHLLRLPGSAAFELRHAAAPTDVAGTRVSAAAVRALMQQGLVTPLEELDILGQVHALTAEGWRRARQRS